MATNHPSYIMMILWLPEGCHDDDNDLDYVILIKLLPVVTNHPSYVMTILWLSEGCHDDDDDLDYVILIKL